MVCDHVTGDSLRVGDLWAQSSVSHRQPELDLIVPLVELDERALAIDGAGSRSLELTEAWSDRPVELGGFTVQATAEELPARQLAEL